MALAIDTMLGIFLLPLFIKFVDSETLGLWYTFLGVSGFLLFYDFGIAGVSIIRISSAKRLKDSVRIGKQFTSSLILCLGLSLLCILTCYITENIILNNIIGEVSNKGIYLIVFRLLYISSSLIILVNFLDGVMNSLLRTKEAKINQIIASIIGGSLTIYFLINGWGILGIGIGFIIKHFVHSILVIRSVLLIFRIEGYTLTIEKQNLFDLVRELKFTSISKITSGASQNLEPYLITTFIAPSLSAYYVITRKIGDLLKILIDKLTGIIFQTMPYAATDLNHDTKRKLLHSVLGFFSVLTISCYCILLILNQDLLKLWLKDDSFILGQSFNLIIMVNFILIILNNFLTSLISSLGFIKRGSNLITIQQAVRIISLITGLTFFNELKSSLLILVVFELLFVLLNFVLLQNWTLQSLPSAKILTRTIILFFSSIVISYYCSLSLNIIVKYLIAFFILTIGSLFTLKYLKEIKKIVKEIT